MKTQGKTDGKRRVAIIGSVVSGRSGDGWYGERFTGSATVMQEIGSAGDIDVYINSPGGSVFAGFEILNALNAAIAAGRTVNIYVSAMAASIASYISSGVLGAKVHMADNAKLMFHAPWTGVQGSKSQLRDTADLLEKMEDDIMKAIVSRGAKEDREWLAAGRAKWLSSKEAVEAKLADDIANPPQDLIDYVVKTVTPTYRDVEWDRTNAKAEGKSTLKLSECDRFAAASSFEGYLQSLVTERFGEGAFASDFVPGEFRATKNDGVSALLKYKADSLNIVAIDWESASFEIKQENVMTAEEKAKAEQKAKEEADAKAKADADALIAQKAKEEADAKAKADAAAKLVADMTPDMVAFAKKNYQIARDEHIGVLKAAGCLFTDEELAKFDIETLAKMAKLTAKAQTEKTSAATTDQSLITTKPTATGTGGSLPPPEQ